MIRAVETSNATLIKRIMTHISVYDAISEDGSPLPSDYEPPDTDAVRYVLMVEDDDILGLFMLVQHNAIMSEIHTCLLPWSHGPKAIQAAKIMERWVWDNTSVQRLITLVPTFNRLALAFARRAGMKQYGLNPKSYIKNDVLWDSVLLGLSRPEEISESCQR